MLENDHKILRYEARLVRNIPWSRCFRPTVSGRVDRASTTEAVDLGSIPCRVKPKTIKIGVHSFPA